MAGQAGRQRHLIFSGALVVVIGIVVAASFFGSDKSSFMPGSVELTGDIQNESRVASNFDQIYLKGAFDATVTAGEEYSLTLEGDSALLALIKTEVQDGKVRIGWDKSVRYKGNNSVRVTVTLPALKGLVFDGVVTATIDNLDSPSLTIALNGASEARLSGTCGVFTATTNGAGEISARDFHCQEATLTINGAGNMEATVSKKITADINGVGNIDIFGAPDDVTINKYGFGNVTFHEESDEANTSDG